MDISLEEAAAAISRQSQTLREEGSARITGPQGPRGERGLPGSRGVDGKDSTVPGPQGLPGIQGPSGTPGRDGKDSTVPGPQGLSGIQGPRGIAGPAGRDGTNGLDGKDALSPSIVIGNVVAGDKASAAIRCNEDGTYILDLTLPFGPRGLTGHTGATGARGRDGNDSVVPGPIGSRGIAGPSGADSMVPGPQGISGKDGMSADDIKRLVVDILSDAGLLSEQAQKLASIRAKLKQAIHQADARHAFQIAEIIRDVDKLF